MMKSIVEETTKDDPYLDGTDKRQKEIESRLNRSTMSNVLHDSSNRSSQIRITTEKVDAGGITEEKQP